MKLLHKIGGLALVPAFFFACEEPTQLGAELNPLNSKIEAHYVEVPLEVKQVKVEDRPSSAT